MFQFVYLDFSSATLLGVVPAIAGMAGVNSVRLKGHYVVKSRTKQGSMVYRDGSSAFIAINSSNVIINRCQSYRRRKLGNIFYSYEHVYCVKIC